MDPLILSILAIGPGIVLAVYIFFADKWEPEPKKLLIQAFILGSLACLPAGFYESVFQEIFGFKGLVDSSVQFSFSEIMFFCFFGVVVLKCFFRG